MCFIFMIVALLFAIIGAVLFVPGLLLVHRFGEIFWIPYLIVVIAIVAGVFTWIRRQWGRRRAKRNARRDARSTPR